MILQLVSIARMGAIGKKRALPKQDSFLGPGLAVLMPFSHCKNE